MDLTSILTRIANDHGLLGAISVILSVALFFAVGRWFKCYDDRVLDLKSNHEIIGSFTSIQQQRQATIEGMVAQIAGLTRAVDLAAQANAATVAKLEHLAHVVNAAKVSNEQMREAIAALRGK